MNSYNAEKWVRKESVRIEAKERRVVRANLVTGEELSLDEDFDIGGDPYNTTGRHVIIKPRINLED